MRDFHGSGKVLCCLIVLLLLMPTFGTASADEAVQLFTHIEANNTSFGPGESTNLYVVPVNDSSAYLDHLTIDLKLPEDISIVDTILPDQPDKLDPYETKVFQYIVRNVSSLATDTLPMTGDQLPPFSLLLLVSVISCLGVGVAGRYFKRMLSLLLVAILISGLLPQIPPARAEGTLLSGHSGHLTLTVAGKNTQVIAAAFAQKTSDLADTDFDNDGLSALEERFFRSDDNSTDTDGDGLPDELEVHILGTDPSKLDTDSNGIADGHEDADEDGLDNLKEIEMGLIPCSPDSDGDGLSDGDEVNNYKTDPLNSDTDGDKMPDGFEVFHGTNPLVFESSVTITESYDKEKASSAVIPTITVNKVSGGQAASLLLTEIPEDDYFLGTELPGYVGNAFDITMNDSHSVSATLTMTYDRSLIGDGFEPVICTFDKETQTLIELPSTDHKDGTISTNLEHFSVYLVVNKKKGSIKKTETIADKIPIPKKECVLLLDMKNSPSDEASMLLEDALSSFHFQVVLAQNKNPMSFKGASQVYTASGTLETVHDSVSELIEHHGFGWKHALASAQPPRVLDSIYLFTSGKNQLTTDEVTELVKNANQEKLKIFIFLITLGSGTYSESDLIPLVSLTSGTGGKLYMIGSKSDLWPVPDGSSYGEEQDDSDLDSNGDGISDAVTRKMVQGKILTTTGRKIFDGFSYAEIQSSADVDGDGIRNRDEIRYIKGSDTVWLLSDPAFPDSDFDGINDNKDASPLNHVRSFVWKSSDTADLSIGFPMNYRWFANNPSKFNRQLAIASSYMADLAYGGKDHTMAEIQGSVQGTSRTIVDFSLHSLGMSDVVQKSVMSYDDVHNAMATIGHHEFTYQGKKHMVLMVGITGYVNDGWEWISNFTVGLPSESGLWKNWTENSHHLGFDIPASLIINELSSYLKEQSVSTEISKADEVDIWTFGHSRGGAISNLIASKIIKGSLSQIPASKRRVFAYDFATPRNTQEENVGTGSIFNNSKGSIFNIINKNDPVPLLPLKGWNFRRYGVDYSFSMETLSTMTEWKSILNHSELVKRTNQLTIGEAFAQISGKGKCIFESESLVDNSVNGCFYKIAQNRDELYSLQEAVTAKETGIIETRYSARLNYNDKSNLSKNGFSIPENLSLPMEKSAGIRAVVANFIKDENERKKKFGIPENRPVGAARYFEADEKNFTYLKIAPQYSMVLMGYLCDHRDMAPDFIAHNIFHEALIGLIGMVAGSTMLRPHFTPAYVLGAYDCRKEEDS